jgi:hypothetical protein
MAGKPFATTSRRATRRGNEAWEVGRLQSDAAGCMICRPDSEDFLHGRPGRTVASRQLRAYRRSSSTRLRNPGLAYNATPADSMMRFSRLYVQPDMQIPDKPHSGSNGPHCQICCGTYLASARAVELVEEDFRASARWVQNPLALIFDRFWSPSQKCNNCTEYLKLLLSWLPTNRKLVTEMIQDSQMQLEAVFIIMASTRPLLGQTIENSSMLLYKPASVRYRRLGAGITSEAEMGKNPQD